MPVSRADTSTTAARQGLMRLCAEASVTELDAALDALAPLPGVTDLRPAERGLVMLRGRMGGDGNRFNLGEATVTRAAVRLESGEIGFAYQLGRDIDKARKAAVLDALGQRPDGHDAVEAAMAPVARRLAMEHTTQSRRIAATRVNFFTMTRGED